MVQNQQELQERLKEGVIGKSTGASCEPTVINRCTANKKEIAEQAKVFAKTKVWPRLESNKKYANAVQMITRWWPEMKGEQIAQYAAALQTTPQGSGVQSDG